MSRESKAARDDEGRQRRDDAEKGELYRRRTTTSGKPFLSNGEQRFYVALRKAVGESYDIHFKMRVADLIIPRAGNWRRGYGEAVCRQHVDFVVCKKWTSYPVCCVETR